MRLICPGVADSLVNLSFFFPGPTEERGPRFASVKRIVFGCPLLFSSRSTRPMDTSTSATGFATPTSPTPV